jgi:hypothetical protein
MKCHTWVRAIKPETVDAYDTLTKAEMIMAADTVVLALGGEVQQELYLQLKGKVKELFNIGDSLGARGLEPAIYEGFIIGVSL